VSFNNGTPTRLAAFTGYYGFVLIGWNSVLIPALIHPIQHDFQQGDAAFGLFFFVSSLAYGLAAFFSGPLTERFGRRAVLATCTLLGAVGLCAEVLAPGWPLLLAAVVPTAWGAGTIDAGVNALFLDLYRTARGGALNLLHMFFSVGAFVGPFAVGWLLSAGTPWRPIVLAVSVGFLLLAFAFARAAMPSGRRRAGETEVAASAELSGSERSLVPFAGLALSIGLYVAMEMGISNWVVKLELDAHASIELATGVLSAFWLGLTIGRLLSKRLAERIDYALFTCACIALASLVLIGAALVPWPAAGLALFGLVGLFSGPIYPMIMAMGGNIYPHRLAALSGSLAAAAVAGSVIYPPLMGALAGVIGLRSGMIGAALLGVPAIGGILLARRAVRR
jgi:fucose permease